jgi:hypothetical protein
MRRERPYNQAEKGRQNMTATATAPTGGDLLTINELADRLQMHPDTVRGLWRRRVFPGLVIGHRTLRFEYPAVLDALRRAGDQASDQAE